VRGDRRSTDLRSQRDAGFSLIELLVAMGLFGLLSSILLGAALSTSKASTDTSKLGGVGEETRTAMERMTRELRQAATLRNVQLAAADNDGTRFTLWTDFNGNQCLNAQASDPEALTYAWNSTTGKLTLSAVIGGQTKTDLVLAATVTSFTLDLNSSYWQYDTDHNGTTTWQELDASSIGDHDPRTFTDAELRRIDLVRLSMTATDGTHTVNYSTRVDLRNRTLDGDLTPC
jgi:prepilin-type N-terminal cleavage/methylation domain-containing protein